MEDNLIKILGVSEDATIFIKSFMAKINGLDGNDSELIPIIGLVHSSTSWDENGNPIKRGEHFVLGAITRSQIDDEIFFDLEGMEIAIRIPLKSRFYGVYYFDIFNDELVSAKI